MSKDIFLVQGYSNNPMVFGKFGIDAILAKVQNNQKLSSYDVKLLIDNLRIEKDSSIAKHYINVLVNLLSDDDARDKVVLKALADKEITKGHYFTKDAINIVRSKLKHGMNDLVYSTLSNINRDVTQVSKEDIAQRILPEKKPDLSAILNDKISLNEYKPVQNKSSNKRTLLSRTIDQSVKDFCLKTGTLNILGYRVTKNYIEEGNDLGDVEGAIDHNPMFAR